MDLCLCLGIFAPMQTYKAIYETYIFVYIWTFFVFRHLCSDAKI